MAVKHEYPACAIYRGGKCSCDESDKICHNCGSEEWDRITDRTSPGASFNRCNRCGNEWEPKDSAPQEAGKAEFVQPTREEVEAEEVTDAELVLPAARLLQRMDEMRASKEAGKVEPVAEGWKLVPVKPTEDMLYKMAECDGYLRGDRDHPMLTQWEDYWNMALEASPSPLALSDEDLDLLWLEHRPPGVSNEEQYRCARKFARAILAAAGGSEK